MTAYGYVRQSRRADQDVSMSAEQQRSDIAALAARDGVTVTAIFEDLGRSGGDGKEGLRAGYQDLIAALESGAATVVYAKALTRLGRSVTELYRVLRLASKHGCRIVTAKEGVMDPGTAIGKAQFGMMAVFAEFERDLASERAADNVATRRARGERLGRLPYGSRPGEDVAVVVAAFEATGSWGGAARKLNADGVPSALGRVWGIKAVAQIIQRERGDLVPARTQRGARTMGTFRFSQLLRCHCGATMTGRNSDRGRGVRYHCAKAASTPDHGRTSVYESAIIDWMKAEAGRVQMPDVLEMDDRETPRAALVAKRSRVMDAFVEGLMDKAERDRRLATINEALASLRAVDRIVEVPDLDWTWTPSIVNKVLAALFVDVQLGADMMPVEATWRLPSEYVGDRPAAPVAAIA